MAVQPIPLMGLGLSGKSPNVTAQLRTNLYCEVTQDPEKGSSIAMFPTPGLAPFANLGDTPIRGAYPLGNFTYLVHRANVWKMANDGTTTLLGTIATQSGRVSMADNGSQIMIADGANGYVITVATGALTQITAPGWPGGDTNTYHNGYFIVNKPGTGRFHVSGLYDGTAWNALDFATAESSPDSLVRVMSDQGQIVLFGEKTTEFWGDSGAADFPYARIGGGTVEWGLAARWSLAKFNNSLAFLRKNRLGQVQVALLQGYDSVPISTPDLDYRINSYATVSDATGFAYTLGGHHFYQINFPTGNESWLYDGTTQAWSKVSSLDVGRHRADQRFGFLEKPYVCDYSTGQIYLFDQNTYTDNGGPIAREFIGRHQTRGDWTSLDELWIEMEGGVGVSSGQGATPKAMLQVSKDGGHTWGNELWADLGAMGKYSTRAVWRRLGRARDWVFRVRVTDPVKTVFVAAWGRFNG